jgi:AraC-like DNA-binding protein
MRPPLLDPEVWPVLLEPTAWKVVSSACPPEATPAAAPGHREWMATHSHAHPYRELLLVLRGTGFMGHCGEVYPLAPGLVFVFEPGEAHDLEWPPWAPDADHLWFGFMGDNCFARVLTVRGGRLSRASDLGALLTPGQTGVRLPPLEEARRYPPGWRRLQLLVGLGSLISLLVKRGYDEEGDEAAPFQERVIQTVREHIAQTAGREADLGSLARLAGYSKFHFLRLFKAHTGCTVHQYVDQCRWARAQELLGQRRRQADIAADLGFSGPAAFSRWRKQHEARAREGSAASEPE